MELPAELVCPLCGYLLEDAVMLPCCAASACNLCAREGLEVSDGRCPVPDCPEPEGISADDLIPNRQLRSKAAAFKERNPGVPTRPAPKKVEEVVKDLVEQSSSPPPPAQPPPPPSLEAVFGGSTEEEEKPSSPDVDQFDVAPPGEEDEGKMGDESSPPPELPSKNDQSPLSRSDAVQARSRHRPAPKRNRRKRKSPEVDRGHRSVRRQRERGRRARTTKVRTIR